MSHKHEIKKTHVTFVEFDDVIAEKLALNTEYFGEGNSKDRKLEFDFEYCLNCNLRLLNGNPAMTQGILEDEFERYVKNARNNRYQSVAETTVQHSDFEVLQNLIRKAMEFGKLRANNS
jgi:hypothetical protein